MMLMMMMMMMLKMMMILIMMMMIGKEKENAKGRFSFFYHVIQTSFGLCPKLWVAEGSRVLNYLNSLF